MPAMSKTTAWWVHLWIPLLIAFFLLPALPMYLGGLAIFHVVWFLIRDHREVRAGRRSGLWRFFAVGGFLLLAIVAGSLRESGDTRSAEAVVAACVFGVLLAVFLWWMLGPVLRAIRGGKDRLTRSQGQQMD